MKLDNRGGTMVEIVVGFALILIIIASFLHIIKLSSNMTMYAVDSKDKLATLQETYYEGGSATEYKESVISGYDKEKGSYVFDKKISLVSSDKYGNEKNNSIMFPLSHATLLKIENNSSDMAKIAIYRLLYSSSIQDNNNTSTDTSNNDGN